MNWWLFKLSECKLGLEGNSEVLEKMRHFYKEELLQETGDLGSEVGWIAGCEESIMNFVHQLDQIIQDMDDVLQKANQIYLQAQNRERYVSSSPRQNCHWSTFMHSSIAGADYYETPRCRSSSRTT
jgi:hypothetical protein